MFGIFSYILKQYNFYKIDLYKKNIEKLTFPGSYILIIQINKLETFRNWKFYPGVYTYIGSAKNGLSKRLSRHISDKKKLFWHIDYLLSFKTAKILEIYISSLFVEKKLAKIFEKFYRAIPNFGNSDDKKAISHLFLLKKL